MIYFCADDYGISKESNETIERCLKHGALNKVSVLPNGDLSGLASCLSDPGTEVSLHLNLVEGRPLSDPAEIGLLLDGNGCFKDSFAGLLLRSLTPGRTEFERQLSCEIRSQLRFWKAQVGDGRSISIDSHQHVHMIPLIFRTLLRVIREEGIEVHYLRIPAEPILPYLLTPSLYFTYRPVGLVKQWVLKFLALVNRSAWKKSGIRTACFMGVLFSGNMDRKRVKALLGPYARLAEKRGQHLEAVFHPGGAEDASRFMPGIRSGFRAFYESPGRKVEFDTLMDPDLHTIVKEGV